VNVEEIKIPAAFDVPDRLKYIRSNLLDVIREFRVESAGVRVTEPNADASTERIQIEGVIQESYILTMVQMGRSIGSFVSTPPSTHQMTDRLNNAAGRRGSGLSRAMRVIGKTCPC
jgi:hypothetical protein